MGNLRPYSTAISVPQSGLFAVFLIDFAGPLPITANQNKYLLICVEHLTGWPIMKPNVRATAEELMSFVEQERFHSFGPPTTVVSDNATYAQDTARVHEDKRNIVKKSLGIRNNVQSRGRENVRHNKAFRRARCSRNKRAVGQSC